MWQYRKLITRLLPIMAGFAALFFSFANPAYATALSAADWNAGNIIDDSMFFSPAQMSTEDIQAFLNSKVAICDTNGSQAYGGTTRADYGTSRGYPPPYTCVKDYLENPTTHQNNANGGSVNGGWSAAQIIKSASDTYGINPKSLIVLLEKEQALITDDWPWTVQYRSATGYGCPDTAPCDAQYYGFYNQVMNAASQFKRYATSPTYYRYKAYQPNYIQYNPNTSCGGTTVSLVNQATAGLYNYTPYQPNASALANLYGSGDSCGAYGNRNFWRLFNQWFGDTHAAIYAASFDGVDNYSDATKTQSIPATPMVSGNRTYMVLRFKNTGNITWRNSGVGAVRLATIGTSYSPFCDSTWLSCERPASMTEASVAPGGIATFAFWYKAPSVSNDTSMMTRFGIIAETVATMGGSQQVQTTLVQKPVYNAAYDSVDNFTDATKSVSIPANTMVATSRTYMVLRFKNIGNTPWYKSGMGAIRLGVLSTFGGSFCDATWLSCQRPAEMKEAIVNPGQLATFEFWYTAPVVNNDASIVTKFGVIAETVATMDSLPQWQTTLVKKQFYSAAYQSVENYTDSTKTVSTPATPLISGTKTYMVLRFKNTGNTTWRNSGTGAVRVAVLNSPSSPFCDATWLSCQRPAEMKEAIVNPGEVGSFEFWYKAPIVTIDTNYLSKFGVIAETVATLDSLPQWQTTLVHRAQ